MKFIDWNWKRKKKKRKKVAILVDYENLWRCSDRDIDLKQLGRFLDHVSSDEEKDIMSFQVFTPSYLTNGGVSLIYQTYRPDITFIPPQLKICPRNFITKTGKVKDVDSVDWQIHIQAMWLADYCLVDEIMVISNDYDLSAIGPYVRRRGVRFRKFSTSNIFSGDYHSTYTTEKEKEEEIEAEIS